MIFHKKIPAGMGNGKKGRIFPKMKIYTEFDYDKVVELVADTHSAIKAKGAVSHKVWVRS